MSFVTAELSSLKYVDICLSGDDSRDIKRVSALCDSGAEICVANSSVVEGLNLDPVGQIQLRPFCGNTVTADIVCLNVFCMIRMCLMSRRIRWARSLVL